MNVVSKYLRQTLKAQFEDHLNVKIYSSHAHGREDWFDIKKTNWKIETIFDVGANIGQSVSKFRKAFPESKIFCFEPVESVFEKLVDNTRDDRGVSLHKIALGDVSDHKSIYLTPDSTTNSFGPVPDATDVACVPVSTVDDFMKKIGIDRVDLLKVDVEGYDLKVLEGAQEMLRAHRIVFVIAEVGFNESDSLHVAFEDVRRFLALHGYVVFGIYDQQLEWSGRPKLRYANACFCSEETIAKR